MSVSTSRRGAVRLPDFLGLGAMRCGSTTLWAMMKQDPRLAFPAEKELHYFDNRAGFFDRGLYAYSDWFADAPADALCGESTPEYLYLDEARQRIRQVLPDAKFICILRDPVQRAWSHYWFRVRQGYEKLSVEKALDAEPARMRSDDEMTRLRFRYVSWGLYADYLERYEQDFPRQAMCVVTLEELKRNPAQVMARIQRHLGLKPRNGFSADNGKLEHKNLAMHPRWRWLYTHSRRALRWAEEDDNSLVRRGVGKVANRLTKANEREGIPQMPEHVRARLAEAFAESDRRLAKWLGRELPWAPARGATR